MLSGIKVTYKFLKRYIEIRNNTIVLLLFKLEDKKKLYEKVKSQ